LSNSILDLKAIASSSRKRTLELVFRSKSSHLGSSLSAIEIFVAVLHSARVPENVVVSKGHAAAGFYSVLSALGHIIET
jgi:transketolase N-terminal domain/subunit